MAKKKKYDNYWDRVSNPNYEECVKVLYEVADEYLKKALDKLDEYLAEGYTHLRAVTIAGIPGCYNENVVYKRGRGIEQDCADPKDLECYDERYSHFGGLVKVFEINSVKKFLTKEYGKVGVGPYRRYPAIVYHTAEKRCKELGIV